MPELQKKCVVFVGLCAGTFLCPLLNFCLNAFFIDPEKEDTKTMTRIQRDSRGKGIASFVLYGTLFPVMLIWIAVRADTYIRSPFDIPIFIAFAISVILTIFAVVIKLRLKVAHIHGGRAGKFIMISYLVPLISGAILLVLYNIYN